MKELRLEDPKDLKWKMARSILEKKGLVDDFTRLGKYKDYGHSFRTVLEEKTYAPFAISRVMDYRASELNPLSSF